MVLVLKTRGFAGPSPAKCATTFHLHANSWPLKPRFGRPRTRPFSPTCLPIPFTSLAGPRIYPSPCSLTLTCWHCSGRACCESVSPRRERDSCLHHDGGAARRLLSERLLAADRAAPPVCQLLHRLSESQSNRTYGGGVGGPERLWFGPGIRRSERSRGVAERSLVGGTGREGKPRKSALAAKSTLNRPEPTQETASPEERYKKIVLHHGAVHRLLSSGYFPPSPLGSAAGNHPGPGCYR
jgi:hypothetical protein